MRVNSLLIATFLLFCLIFAAHSIEAASTTSPLKQELSRLLKLKKQLNTKWDPRRYLNERILRIARRFSIVIPQRCKRRVVIDDEVVDTIRKLAECDRDSKPELPSTPSNPTTPTTPSNPSTPTTPSVPSVPTTPSNPTTPTTPSTPSNPSVPSVPTTPTVPACPKRRTCRLLCKNGYYFDANGCVDTCRCKPSGCPQFRCLRACPYGYKVNSRGCTTCDCKPKPSTPTVPTTPTTPTFECPKRKCGRLCAFGYKTDRRGCQTCACVRRTPVRPVKPTPVKPVKPTPVKPVEPVKPTPVKPTPVIVPTPVVKPTPVIRPTPVRPPIIVRPPIVRPRRRRRFFGRGRGDPHYSLLESGKSILFNGLGDFILAETQDKEFIAHVRIGKWHKKATVNIGAAIKIGKDSIEFNAKDGQFYLNKEEAEFKVGKKYELEGGYFIRKSENRFIVKSIDGVEFFGERFTLHDGKSYMDVQVDSPKDIEFRRGLIVNGKGRQGKGIFRNTKRVKVNRDATAVVAIPKWAKKACAKQGLTGKQLKDCAYDITVTGKEFAKEIAKDEAKFARKSNKVLKTASKK